MTRLRSDGRVGVRGVTWNKCEGGRFLDRIVLQRPRQMDSAADGATTYRVTHPQAHGLTERASF